MSKDYKTASKQLGKSNVKKTTRNDFKKSDRRDFKSSDRNDFKKSERRDFKSSDRNDFKKSDRRDFKSSDRNDFKKSDRRDFKSSDRNDFKKSDRRDFKSSDRNDFKKSDRRDFKSSDRNDFKKSDRRDFKSSDRNDFKKSDRRDFKSSDRNDFKKSDRRDFKSSDRNDFKKSDRRDFKSSDRNDFKKSDRRDFKSSDRNDFKKSDRRDFKSSDRNDFKKSDRRDFKSSDRNDFKKSDRKEARKFGDSKKGLGVYREKTSHRANVGRDRRDFKSGFKNAPKFILQMPNFESQDSDKLQKVLANYGLGSRRTMEEKIKLGQIKVNGEIANLGMRVSDTDKIFVDGKPLKKQLQARRVLVYNKPEGELVTRFDEEGRDIVFSHLPHLPIGRWIPVGRLDINTSGLLLFTNDGELADALAHPSNEMSREYMVRVLGDVKPEHIEQLKQGVELDDGMAHFNSIEALKVKTKDETEEDKVANSWYKVSTSEGRNRIVRRLWEALGFSVSRLKRINFAGIHLNREDKQGQWREVSVFYIEQLSKELNLPVVYADENQSKELAKLMRMDRKLVSYATKNQIINRRDRDGRRDFGKDGWDRKSDWKKDKKPFEGRDRKFSKKNANESKVVLGKNRPPRKEKIRYKNPNLKKDN